MKRFFTLSSISPYWLTLPLIDPRFETPIQLLCLTGSRKFRLWFSANDFLETQTTIGFGRFGISKSTNNFDSFRPNLLVQEQKSVLSRSPSLNSKTWVSVTRRTIEPVPDDPSLNRQTILEESLYWLEFSRTLKDHWGSSSRPAWPTRYKVLDSGCWTSHWLKTEFGPKEILNFQSY